MYLTACMKKAMRVKMKKGILWTNGRAAAADADSPSAIAPIVVRPVVQRVEVVALSLPVLFVSARAGRGPLIV